MPNRQDPGSGFNPLGDVRSTPRNRIRYLKRLEAEERNSRLRINPVVILSAAKARAARLGHDTKCDVSCPCGYGESPANSVALKGTQS